LTIVKLFEQDKNIEIKHTHHYTVAIFYYHTKLQLPVHVCCLKLQVCI